MVGLEKMWHAAGGRAAGAATPTWPWPSGLPRLPADQWLLFSKLPTRAAGQWMSMDGIPLLFSIG